MGKRTGRTLILLAAAGAVGVWYAGGASAIPAKPDSVRSVAPEEAAPGQSSTAAKPGPVDRKLLMSLAVSADEVARIGPISGCSVRRCASAPDAAGTAAVLSPECPSSKKAGCCPFKGQAISGMN